MGEKLVGSNSNLSVLSGSAHNLLDPAKMMSLQEDARSRKISSEVMKRCLYKSVTAPCRRRIINRMSCSGTSSSGNFYSRKMLSLPVTPMQSLRVTPSQSPTEDRRFFYGFLSHGPTPRSTTPVRMGEEDEEEDDDGRYYNKNIEDEEERDCKGLASLFKPQPRYVVARVWSQQNCDELPDSRGELVNPIPVNSAQNNSTRYRPPNLIIKRKAMNAASPI